jgi:DNA-binding protein YbaB
MEEVMSIDQNRSYAFDAAPEVAEVLERIARQAEDVQRVQRDIEVMTVKGYSRQDEVTATMRGTGRFTDVTIDPDLIRQYDAYDLGAIVLEAVNDALEQLAAATAEKYAPMAEASGITEWAS